MKSMGTERRSASAGILALAVLAACSARPAPAPAPPATQPPASLPAPSPVPGRTARAEAIQHGPRSGGEIALTFDADMTQGMLIRLHAGQASFFDPSIIEELRDTGTPATIFLTGLWVQAYPQVVRSLASDPLFELANHTMDHPAFEKGCYRLRVIDSPAAKRQEVLQAAEAISDAAGRQPFFFRFPGDCHARPDLSLVASLGEQPVGGDASGDPFEPDPSRIVRTVLGRLSPGSIVIMHLMGAPNAPATSRALKALIPIIRQRGLHPVTLSTLLGYPADPLAPSPVVSN